MRLCALFLLSFVITLLPPSPGEASTTPSSPRSRKVAARIVPELRQTLSSKNMPWGAPVYIRIFKLENRLELWLKQHHRFRLFRSYPICTYGGMGLGPKTVRGDARAPEGFYHVTARQMNPFSRYYLSFNLGYPNAYDRLHGRTGSALMVHGECVSIGCFAMTNGAIEEIYILADTALNNGQSHFKVHIFPFRMTSVNMHRYAHGPWERFWQNLKEGYDRFEDTHIPPEVAVQHGRYVFK